MRRLLLPAFTAFIIGSCSSSKSVTTASTAVNSPSTTSAAAVGTNSSGQDSVVTGPSMAGPSSNGIYAPGSEELIVIKKYYPDVTLETLNEGHVLYTQGACINCHGPKNIYTREVSKWKKIIDDMGQMANISDVQKDAVYKYVIAIKANQPK